MGSLSLDVRIEEWPLAKPFKIAGCTFTTADLIVVVLSQHGYWGKGEAAGVHYLNETPISMREQIEGLRAEIERGIAQDTLQEMLPPGGARNALDCALWDLQAKRAGKTIWELTGTEPKRLMTIFTLGIEDTTEQTVNRAREASKYPVLKVKLDGRQVVERVSAIRAARPEATLLVDANQGWSFEQLTEWAPKLAELDVKLIEQPLPRDQDEALEGYKCPVPLSADESCQHRGELNHVRRRYQVVNIKLDKAGGLTEGLLLANAARGQGLKLQAGCMIGTSLSMAPTFVLAQSCQYPEIDGHLLLARDRVPALACEGAEVCAPDPKLWG